MSERDIPPRVYRALGLVERSLESREAMRAVQQQTGGTAPEMVQSILDGIANLYAKIPSEPPTEAGEQECPTCEGDMEVHVSTSVPGDDGFVTCPTCGGTGTMPTPAEITELRERCWRAEGDLQAMTDERDAALNSPPPSGEPTEAEGPEAPTELWYSDGWGEVQRWRRPLGADAPRAFDPDDAPEEILECAPTGWSVFYGTIRALTAEDLHEDSEHPAAGYQFRLSPGDEWWDGGLRPATASEVLAFFALRAIPTQARAREDQAHG